MTTSFLMGQQNPQLAAMSMSQYMDYNWSGIIKMRIQQEVASDLTIRQLIADRTRRHKLVTVLLHTLETMGFTQSLQQLQQESNIRLQPSAQQELKLLFQQGKYSQAEAVVQNLPLLQNLKQQITQTLLELKLLQLIQKADYQPAIELLACNWRSSQDKQLQFLQMIATAQPVLAQQVTSRQLQVLQKCQAESFQLKLSIDHMLKGYLGLSQTEHQISIDQQPPCNIVAQSQAIHNTHFSFARLHPKGQSVCLVAETNSSIEVSLWSVASKRIKKQKQSTLQGLGWVNTVQWNMIGEILAICTYNKIALIAGNSQPFKPFIIINASDIANGKLLCAKWNYFDQIYVGGLFEGIIIINIVGKVVHSIRPFSRTRDLIFIDDGIVAISATQPLVSKLRIVEQQVTSKFQGKHSFMSIAKDEKGERVIVANKNSIFLLDSEKLQLLATFKSPDNPKMWKIEVFMYKEWLIIFNQQLTATTVNQNQVVRHHTWSDCQAMHLLDQKMVTVGSKIVVWQANSQPQKTRYCLKRELQEDNRIPQILAQNLNDSAAQFLSSSSEEQSIQQQQDESMQQEQSSEVNVEEGSNDEADQN